MCASQDTLADFRYIAPREGGCHRKYLGCSSEVSGTQVSERYITCEQYIRDARTFSAYPLKLSTVGFELISCEISVCGDFLSQTELIRTYVPEIEAAVKPSIDKFLSECSAYEHLTVRAIRSWDLCLRRSGETRKPAEVGNGIFELAPLQIVHGDFFGSCSPEILTHLLNKGTTTLSPCGLCLQRDDDNIDMVPYLNGELPLLSINVWRSIDKDNPVIKDPLAVCDPRSIPEERRVKYEIICPDVVGVESRFYPDHEAKNGCEAWFYYPEMSHTECLLFFSDGFLLPTSTQQFFYNASVPHASFKLKQEVASTERRSIEVRMFVFLQ